MFNHPAWLAQLEKLKGKIRAYAADAIEDPDYKDALEERIGQAEWTMQILIDLIKEAE